MVKDLSLSISREPIVPNYLTLILSQLNNKDIAHLPTTRILRSVSVTTIFLLAAVVVTFAQKPDFAASHSGLQYGAAVKSLMDLAGGKFHFRIAVGAGAGYMIVPDVAFLSTHLDFVVYNNGLGSPKPGLRKPSLEKDIIGGLTITGGGSYRFSYRRVDMDRYIPLYYFSNLNRHSLQNPFLYSLSLGSNVVFNSSRKIKYQRIGFIHANVNGLGISYYNDGTPFGNNLGDGHDRYYTGGGILSYHASMRHTLNAFELAYLKFTGYHENAFEIANALDQSFVNYRDQSQQKYNKSLFSLSLGSSHLHWAVGLNIYNDTQTDYQHTIHNLIFNGYHRVPYSRSITPYISGSAYTSKIGLK